jgi:uncharacterized protein
MPVLINLRHLEAHNIELQGELPVGELDLDLRDDIVRAEQPLHYELEVQKLEGAVLLQGCLRLKLNCQCVRCLKPFEYSLVVRSWTRHLALEGEEKVPVTNDCVDLTPYVREDILLEFPQHPLCETNCRGLPKKGGGKVKPASDPGGGGQERSAWAELDKLKL